MLIDTHTHLYLKDFDDDRESVFQRAWEAGVGEFYLPNIDSESIEAMFAVEKAHPEKCFAMMGLHPCSVNDNFQEELKIVESWLSRRAFCAIGEIGLDLYWDKSSLEFQKRAFLMQVNWAKELDIPIVIHSRESIDLIISLLKKEKSPKLRGIFHCFTGDEDQAKEIIKLGFHMGIGGVLTFKNAGLDQVIKSIPLEWLVLETDSPYLAPVPYRGKRNESAYVKLIAEKLSEVQNVDFERVSATTTSNAKKIFKKNPQAYTTLS